MSQLPYANSTTTPHLAQERIRKALIKFGVSRISFDEDIENHKITVHFKYKDYPVSIPIDHGALAEEYIRRDEWATSRQKEKYRKAAFSAAFAMLESFIKPMLIMVETGTFSFEEIFISYFIGKDGKRLGEEFKRCLPQWVAGQKALTEGGS